MITGFYYWWDEQKKQNKRQINQIIFSEDK